MIIDHYDVTVSAKPSFNDMNFGPKFWFDKLQNLWKIFSIKFITN